MDSLQTPLLVVFLGFGLTSLPLLPFGFFYIWMRVNNSQLSVSTLAVNEGTFFAYCACQLATVTFQLFFIERVNDSFWQLLVGFIGMLLVSCAALLYVLCKTRSMSEPMVAAQGNTNAASTLWTISVLSFFIALAYNFNYSIVLIGS